jgi:leader peptidase (prepilin peptidase)/N-methyltransferase
VVSDTTLAVVFAALIGLVVGSFLNVVIARVPEGLSVVHPPSRCPRCGHQITARENIPVLSWLLLKRRCSGCHEPISARYPLVELLTAVVFVLLTLRFGVSWELPAYLYLGAVGTALAFIDLDTKRLPDRLTLPSYAVALVLLALPAWQENAWDSLLRAVLGGLALGALYFVLWFVYPSGMGFGDVKFSGVLGMYLGWISWATVALGGFLGFLLGGIGGIVLLVSGRATRKTGVPFGPYMILGALLAILWGQAVIDWYSGLAFSA